MNKFRWLKVILPVLTVLSILCSLLLIAIPVHAAPADAYWVGGSGNWTDAATHWASSSGGAPGQETYLMLPVMYTLII